MPDCFKGENMMAEKLRAPDESTVELRIWYASCTEVVAPVDASRRLALSHQESSLLNRVLGTYLGDLRMEISGTDNPQMRRDLREEESLLRSVRSRLDDLDAETEQ
jgi:hypothetical protein